MLVAPVSREAVPGPYGREKLAPVLSLFTADGEDDGIRLCLQILGNGGCGHTAIIHTRSEQLQLSFAQQMPASRILVNGPGAQGCIGLGNGLTPSLTLGCGTYGRRAAATRSAQSGTTSSIGVPSRRPVRTASRMACNLVS